MSAKQQCENCRFWVCGDVSVKNIGNVGQCTVMMPQTKGFYDKNPVAPFWAQTLSYQTVSWEGRNCGAFKIAKEPRKPWRAENPEEAS